jgi:hypothetical protein
VRFSYYYNRIKSAEQKKTVLTVRWGKEKMDVEKVMCYVPHETHNRKIRPYCVVIGEANIIIIDKNVARIW